MGASKRLFEDLQQLINEAEEGNKSYIEALIEVKELEESIKLAKEKISKKAYDEACGYSEKTFEKFGKKITPTSKTTWNYKEVPWWNRKNKELEAIQETCKLISKNNAEVYDPETGELVPPAIATHSYFVKIENIKQK